MTNDNRRDLKQELAHCLAPAPEVVKVIVFGSFLTAENPSDIDVAIFSDSDEPYLPLAMRYRRMTKSVSAEIAIDIIPVRRDASGHSLEEIQRGEVIYER